MISIFLYQIVDRLEFFCSLTSGADQPISAFEYDDECSEDLTDSQQYDDDVDNQDEIIDIFHDKCNTNGDFKPILPQPDENMKQLEILVDPVI